MDPGALRDALTVAVGFVSGAQAAAFGVGGATVSTPAVRALGVSATLAVGSTLPAILPSAVAGTIRFARRGLIDQAVVRAVAPAGAVGAVGGSFLSKVVPGDGHVLMIVTAALVGLSAARMIRARPAASDAARSPRTDEIRSPAPILESRKPTGTDSPAPTHPDRSPRPVVMAVIGLAGGGLSGLLGVGGGVILVPALVELGRLALKRAIATSLFCVGVFALVGTISHVFVGDIDWRVALALCVGVVPGARLGAAFTVRAADARLRVAVGAFLSVVAVVYAAGEIVALT